MMAPPRKQHGKRHRGVGHIPTFVGSEKPSPLSPRPEVSMSSYAAALLCRYPEWYPSFCSPRNVFGFLSRYDSAQSTTELACLCFNRESRCYDSDREELSQSRLVRRHETMLRNTVRTLGAHHCSIYNKVTSASMSRSISNASFFVPQSILLAAGKFPHSNCTCFVSLLIKRVPTHTIQRRPSLP